MSNQRMLVMQVMRLTLKEAAKDQPGSGSTLEGGARSAAARPSLTDQDQPRSD